MAMRPRTPTFRTNQSVRRIYETLQPKSEMKETPEAFLLHVYLPGYTKERIKITFVWSSRKVKVSGERPIQGNKWSRFEQTYPVPENCNPEALEAKFEVGTLVLTMPKNLSVPQETLNTPQGKTRPTPNKAEDAKLEEPLMGNKKAQKGTEEATSSSSSYRPIESPKLENESRLKALFPPSEANRVQDQIIKRPPLSDEKPSKRQKEDEAKTTLTAVARDSSPAEKREDEARLKTRLAAVRKQLEEKEEDERLPKKEKEVKEEYGKTSEARKVISNDDDVGKGVLKEKEIRMRKVSSKLGTGDEVSSDKSKQDMIDTVGNGIRELVASASLVVTRIKEGKWNDEEKDLVVNIAAAFAVIAGLGAYVSYRFVSS
ncbi:inactive protein RESTRICTED TEV MOVEMENT 2-like [Arachis stenosperma]|uniref:inactive protein RESTRICTED TEV MOVEMENT 2-like n=1 Tax=Arachis stenosperma TaxID=217475 RepID=UPI0025AB62CE|nr:inactive protein RESTRICTED TEV MOVEMENT 2-like [Arachis stenosperma]